MVLEYIDSPLSHRSTHASDQSASSKDMQKYKRISVEKRKLLLEKIFFENKKIKKAAKELNLNYSSAKTILHLYRKKIKKPKIDENSHEVKRACYRAINSKNQLNPFEIIATQGGRDLKDLFFTQKSMKIKQKSSEKLKMTIKEEETKSTEEGRSFVEKFLIYKEMEKKFQVNEGKMCHNDVIPKILPKIEEKNSKNMFRKAIIIKPIDPLYAQ